MKAVEDCGEAIKEIAMLEVPDGGRSYSFAVSWFGSIDAKSVTVVGPGLPGEAGGTVDVWAAGEDFADAVANAIRFVEGQGRNVMQVGVNI